MFLNKPIKVGNMTLKNRILFPPLTTGYEERDGSIGERSFNFYKRLAEGGVSYIVLGDVAPVNTTSPTPKLFSDSQIPAFQRLADACHQYDTKLALQIFHPEYDAQGVGERIVKSRMLAQQGKKEECDAVTKEAYAFLHHSMAHFVDEATVEQLASIKQAIVDCAIRAEKAGIDAIQIHGDRLVGSLCSTLMNHRTDDYGGSFENRTRFAIEVVRALKQAVPSMTIDYKLPVITPMEGGLRGKGGLELAEAVQLAVLLEKEGVDMLHVAQANHTGNMNDTIPYMGTREYGFTVYASEAVKKAVSIPVCAVGRIITVEAVESLLANGKCDLIGLGRSLVCDPDYVKKAIAHEPIRHCINCNKGCTDSIIGRTYCQCVLNAENGEEYKRTVVPAENSQKVAVVGGGIAGLEAARVAALKGHKVTLFEKSFALGGQLNIASVPPRKNEILRAIAYYENILPKLGVTIVLGKAPTVGKLNKFHHVIVAVGATNVTLNVPGAKSAHVVSAWDVLQRKQTLFGKVAVIGGGLVGTETASYLAHEGVEVAIVEMQDKIAAGESSTVLPEIKAEFARYGVQEYVNSKLLSVGKKSVRCENTVSGNQFNIPADFVVMAVGAKSNAIRTDKLKAQVHFCGDCVSVADISHAVRTAYDVANSIE